MHFESSGAYTGEISAEMLRHLFCKFVILGHSERREYFGETDSIVNKKVLAALAASLSPILCVGETLEQLSGRGAKVCSSCRSATARLSRVARNTSASVMIRCLM